MQMKLCPAAAFPSNYSLQTSVQQISSAHSTVVTTITIT